MQQSSIDLSAEKRRLRGQILTERQAILADQKARMDEALCEAVWGLPEMGTCRLLLCYYPVRGEIDLLELACRALARGLDVAFPISHTDGCVLTFHKVGSLDELTAGAYGIPEPSPNVAAITDFTDAVCLVPALSIDRDGYRLGYGKGYYDRFLSEFHGCSVGLVYSRFLRDQLPRNATDHPVDRILTEKGELCHETQGGSTRGNLSKKSIALRATDS